MINLESVELNLRLFQWINSHNLPILDIVFYLITYLGSGWIMLPVAAALYKMDKNRIIPALSAYLTSSFTVQLIKYFWSAPRPVSLLSDVHVVGETLKAASFPSGHTATAFVLFYVLAHRKGIALKLGLSALALAVGYSRIYVGAHFPFDVFGGGIIGLTAGYISVRYENFFRKNWKELLVLFAIPAFIFYYRLGALPFFIVDEARNSEAAREMLERLDFLVPTYNYELRTDKPPLHYWIFILAYKIFGVSEFSSRVFSPLFGIATVVITYRFALKRLNRDIALLSALMLPVSLYSFLLFRMAVPDPFFVFFSTAALFAFYIGYTENNYRCVFLFYILTGLAVLTKGPVGIALPFGVAFTFVFFKGMLESDADGFKQSFISGLKATKIFFTSRHLYGYLILGAIAVPWYVIVSMKTSGAFSSGFFMHHNINRFFTSLEGPKGPFIITLLFLIAGFFPWSIFLFPVAISSYRERKDPLVLYLLVWVLIHLIFYSISATKLPHYMVPVYPALCILIAKVFLQGMSYKKTSLSFLIAAGLLICVAVVISGSKAAEDFMPWIALLGMPFLIGGIIALFTDKYALHAIAGSAIAFILIISGWLMPASEKYFIPKKISGALTQIEQSSGEAIGSVYSYGYYDPAFEYYLRKKIIKVKDLSLVPDSAVLVSTEDKLKKAPELKYRQLAGFSDIIRNKEVMIVKIGGKESLDSGEQK